MSSITNELDHYFMQQALKEAKKAALKEEVPVGAVIVKEQKIIASAHNLRETKQNPLAHAELLAIHKAAKKLVSWRLLGCSIYVTLEPCSMCAGAMIAARLEKLVFGAYDKKCIANHQVAKIGGLMEPEAREMLKVFFKRLR